MGYLGEGVADDLLTWLRRVVDEETATFIDSVIEDEVGHEADAAADLRAALDSAPDGAPGPRGPHVRCCCTWRGAAAPAPHRWPRSSASAVPTS